MSEKPSKDPFSHLPKGQALTFDRCSFKWVFVKLTLLWVRTKKWTYRDLTLLCVTKANISLSNYLTELDHWY